MPTRYDQIQITGPVTEVIRMGEKVIVIIGGLEAQGCVYLEGQDRHIADFLEVGDTVSLDCKTYQAASVHVIHKQKDRNNK